MRLDEGLQCVPTPGGLRVVARTEEIDLEGDDLQAFLQALPDRLSGTATAAETVAWAADHFAIDARAARGVLRALWQAGALDMAPVRDQPRAES